MSEARTEKERPAYGRPIAEILADLSKPLPEQAVKHRKQGSQDIAYIEWHTAARILDYYAPGWSYEVRRIESIGNQIVATVKITIACAEGLVSREATGVEDEDLKGYGDCFSNSTAMAFKRAAAMFGLGRHLYYKR